VPTNNKNILRDAQGVAIPQVFDTPADNYMALTGSNGAMHIKPSEKKWRAGFTGTSLNPAKWQTVQTGAGQSKIYSIKIICGGNNHSNNSRSSLKYNKGLKE
jgi:hypothetical protein